MNNITVAKLGESYGITSGSPVVLAILPTSWFYGRNGYCRGSSISITDNGFVNTETQQIIKCYYKFARKLLEYYAYFKEDEMRILEVLVLVS